MKKSIKIFLIMLFIILTFGITTSKALTVNSNTTKSSLISALDKRETLYLTGDSYAILRNNDYIYCRQKGARLANYDTKYTYTKTASYPDGTEKGDKIAFTFGYGVAKNFDPNSDIQRSYWYVLGYTEVGENGLAKRAKTYANFKKQERNVISNYGGEDKLKFVVNNKDAKTTTSGEKLVYGPIKIYYSYSSCEISTDKTFTIGGFDFSFSGSSSITDSNVTLCKKDGSKYTRIDNSTKGKVRTSDYSGKDLYILVDVNAIKESKIKMNFKYYTAAASAKLYLIEGTANFSGKRTDYCLNCSSKIANAEAITGTTDSSKILKHEGLYWKYSSHKTVTPNSSNGSYTKYVFAGYPTYNVTATASYDSVTKYGTCCGKTFTGIDAVKKHWSDNPSTHYYPEPGVGIICAKCNNTFQNNNQVLGHVTACSGVSWNSVKNYNNAYQYTFVKRGIPCGSTMEGGGTCGETYTFSTSTKTQNLAVYYTSSYDTDTVEKDIDIPLTETLKITKKWEDFSGSYYAGSKVTRPSSIEFDVYRSIDNKKWDKLDPKTDYKTTWITTEGNTWKVEFSNLKRSDAKDNVYSFKVEEKTASQLPNYEVTYSITDGILDKSLTNKTLTITNTLKYTEIDIEKIWDEQETNYGTRPSKINLEIYRQVEGTDSWLGPLIEGTHYQIEWSDTTTDNWKAKITEIEIANSDRKRYHFLIKEIPADGTSSGSIHYYSPTYETAVNMEDGSIQVKTNNWVRAGDRKKDLKIKNTLRLVDLTITKEWSDVDNTRHTRPENLELVVSRSTDNKNWNVVQNPNITWTKQDNTWIAKITKLLETDKDGNIYKYKVEEVFEDKRYEISYSKNDSIIDTTQSTEMTITNELQLINISVIKEWQDFDAFHAGVRPQSIILEVYRSIDNGKTWDGPLKVEDDYDKIEWSKNGNTWTATIKNLLEKDYNGNVYKYQVKEKEQDKYYNVKYSSGNYTDGNVENNQITIVNELKYIDLEFTKEWKNADNNNWDYANEYNLRPDIIELLVYRSTDNKTWEGPLKQGTDYELQWISTGAKDNIWTAKINKLVGSNARGEDYYFKVEEKPLQYYDPVYDGNKIKYDNNKWKDEAFAGRSESLNIKNKLKRIDISGYVWLDGQTGIKPAEEYNGKLDKNEARMANIVVHLMWKKPQYLGGQTVDFAQTVTDKNGYYEFKDVELGNYFVVFDYDGINYEDTIEGGDSKAFENKQERTTFNNRFQTITYKKSNDGTTLNYEYSDKKSTLITTQNGSTKIAPAFEMNARTEQTFYTENIENLNLGLVKRGTDMALSTDVKDAIVTINGQETTYEYNKEDNSLDIKKEQTSEKVSYTLNLYKSDYYYRIRDYVSNSTFKENGYINDGTPTGAKTGDELKVYVKYELNLQNQSTKQVKINEVKYTFDEKYTFKEIVDGSYVTTQNGNELTINLNGMILQEGETKTIHLLFEVINNNGLKTGDFSNKAEITSYSTSEGYIDIDSQPGNLKDNEPEDDSDTAGGLKVTIENDFIRKIEGKVFDKDNSQNVDDVIVQLIELKTVNGKVYEYIWQETVSGTGKGLKLNNDGTALEEYTYSREKGKYEFSKFIPGDYIVRFIYGDGTTYDMTESVIKYNGQDYKSIKDNNYKAEWYNSSTYSSGESVARDNEARRLETMAYAVEIDAEKGILLKLLNNVTVDDLNETEKETLKKVYNSLYDPDITGVSQADINKLLKEQVLKNTWMCAETSKIKIAVDTENIKNTSSATQVSGGNTYVSKISNVDLGLELRPVTKIELKKYITGLKVTTSSGQTLANAYMDLEEAKAYAQNNNTTMEAYLRNSSNLKGIRDNIIILPNGNWMYDGVSPTEVNTILDGANLEFTYVLVVENTGAEDYLSTTLINSYKDNSDINTYKTLLTTESNKIKDVIRTNGYNLSIGNMVGASYYQDGIGQAKVLTEVTNIRDYVNNDLSFVATGDRVSQDVGPIIHRTLREDYSMQETKINTILKTAPTGKMSVGSSEIMYSVTLSKNPISSTGNLYFDNYIAEVMSLTNAAGRRTMTATPGNAEIVDEYPSGSTRQHEIDEAYAADVNLNASTGENRTIIYIVITIIGISTIAVGALVVKKYLLK